MKLAGLARQDKTGPSFWYVYLLTSRDLIPAAYENDKKLVEFPRMSPPLTCIERIRALWPTRSILTILICKWAISERDIWECVPETGPWVSRLGNTGPDQSRTWDLRLGNTGPDQSRSCVRRPSRPITNLLSGSVGVWQHSRWVRSFENRPTGRGAFPMH